MCVNIYKGRAQSVGRLPFVGVSACKFLPFGDSEKTAWDSRKNIVMPESCSMLACALVSLHHRYSHITMY